MGTKGMGVKRDVISLTWSWFSYIFYPYMEVHMELNKKTTILFSSELHERLCKLAAQRRTSLGDLVCRACEKEYGYVSREDRLAAVRSLAAKRLPVGSPQDMARASVPSPDELAP